MRTAAAGTTSVPRTFPPAGSPAAPAAAAREPHDTVGSTLGSDPQLGSIARNPQAFMRQTAHQGLTELRERTPGTDPPSDRTGKQALVDNLKHTGRVVLREAVRAAAFLGMVGLEAFTDPAAAGGTTLKETARLAGRKIGETPLSEVAHHMDTGRVMASAGDTVRTGLHTADEWLMSPSHHA